MQDQHYIGIIFVSIMFLAWVLPTARAFQKGKTQLGLVGLASGPVAVGLFWLNPSPNVALAVFMALMACAATIWRLCR